MGGVLLSVACGPLLHSAQDRVGSTVAGGQFWGL